MDVLLYSSPSIALVDSGAHPQGRRLLVDVTTTDVGCTTVLNTQKSVTERGEMAELQVYEKLIYPNSQSFVSLAFEMQGRFGPSSERYFAKVKAIALNKRELQEQRYSFWAGFWRRAISVGFQRDIARPR